MKLYFMKQEAIDKLKDNMEIIYEKYYREKDNKWLWNICDGNPFVEYKEIKDFELYGLDLDTGIGEIEFNNCKIIYENMKFLTESQASSERLWAGLCHSVFYEYLRKRWGYDQSFPKNAKTAKSGIISRFFVQNSSRSSLYRNSISKCWWVGHNTYDENNKINKFEKLDIIGSNDISSKINDIFYNYKFSSNKIILNGILKGIEYFNKEGYKITLREHVRPALQLLNAVGGALLLDVLSEEDIAEIIIDAIDSIIHEDSQSINLNNEIENNEIENNELCKKQSDELIEENYVKLGNRVCIINTKNNQEKIIIADYIKGTNKIPVLANKLLGKKENEKVEYKGNIYEIKNCSM